MDNEDLQDMLLVNGVEVCIETMVEVWLSKKDLVRPETFTKMQTFINEVLEAWEKQFPTENEDEEG